MKTSPEAFAAARRNGLSDQQRRAQVEDFNARDDLFTTCQRCRKMIGAHLESGTWHLSEHACVDQ